MYEKRLKAVPPQLFTSNGTTLGQLTISKGCFFKAKQKVIIKAVSLPALILEIKRVEEDGVTLHVGPIRTDIRQRTDISAYTTLLLSSIEADEQERPSIPEQEIERLTYQEEPVVARRSLLVDCLGRPYTVDNPLPVNAIIGATGAAHPYILNVPMPLASTEYTVTLPQGAKRFILRLRNASRCHMAYSVGQTFTNFITLNAGVAYSESDLNLSGALLIYLQSPKAGETAEIVYWTN